MRALILATANNMSSEYLINIGIQNGNPTTKWYTNYVLRIKMIFMTHHLVTSIIIHF